MVATFHLHCLAHRVKYGKPEAGNTTQIFLSTMRPCSSIAFIESFLFWVIFATYNIVIYSCIYIYKVSYIFNLFFLVILNNHVFSACPAKHNEIWKNILWNWRIDCFIARSIKWCYISGCSYWIYSPFYAEPFFSSKLCFLWSPYLLLIAELIRLDTSGKPTVGFFWKTISPSWTMSSISLDEINSVDWFLKS